MKLTAAIRTRNRPEMLGRTLLGLGVGAAQTALTRAASPSPVSREGRREGEGSFTRQTA